MTGTSYPMLDAFLTVLWIFVFVLWIWLLVSVLADVFRSHDLSGGVKALWVVGILVFPLFGVLLYLIVRGGEMHERSARLAQSQQAWWRPYPEQPHGPSTDGVADQLAKLADLRQRGVISDAEFEQAKTKVLGG